ncbi:uncharacterized protein J3D65DRAFT_105626 [Phyllosticta citribraziliensis]|uniref:Uncharacterized protein n=1 Tax=Phyllosticta citribraziliensis TaxID=989973 RepID=A0ABR1LB13_9PEZI
MKASGIVALTLLSAAAAAPHKQHVQLHQNKRDMVWVTEVDEVIETVYQTTTVYVNPGEAIPTSAPAATTTDDVEEPEPTTVESLTTPLVSSTPAESFSTPTPTPTPSSSSASSTYVAPTTLVPVVTSSSSTSVYIPSSTSVVESSAAPAASSVAVQAASVASSDKHTAHLTYYSPDVGTSFCGPVYQNTEPVVALAAGQMSQDMCNKKIKISFGGKTVDGYIGDKCPGCPGTYGLDLSPSLFSALTPLTAGIMDGAEWWFA